MFYWLWDGWGWCSPWPAGIDADSRASNLPIGPYRARSPHDVARAPGPAAPRRSSPVSALALIKRRDVLTAFALLAIIIAAHTLLETARDALFLAKIPATKLPWMYLIIAALALIATQVRIPALEGFARRKLLAFGLALAAAVTAVFWLVSNSGIWVLYALYLWPALFSSIVLVTFWLAMDEDYTVTEAKKVYGLIGAGSTIGAAVGAALA